MSDLLGLAGGICGRRGGDNVLEVPFAGRVVRLVGLPLIGVEPSFTDDGALVVKMPGMRRAVVWLHVIPVDTFVDGPLIEWRGEVTDRKVASDATVRVSLFSADSGTVILRRDGDCYAHMYSQALDAIGGAGNEDQVAMLAKILCEEVARIVVQSMTWRFLHPQGSAEDAISSALNDGVIDDTILRTRIARCWRCSSLEGRNCSIAVNGGRAM